ncbi:MAG: CBS domain-containing protein [Longimicrobiales bacterium]
MTEDPDVLTPDEPVSRAAQVMRDDDVGSVPIVENRSSKRLRGIITDRDIAIRCVAEGHDGSCRISEHMSTGRLRTVRADEDVERVMSVMQEAQVRRIPVVDERDNVIGIIAQADLALEAEDEREVERTVEKISEPSR